MSASTSITEGGKARPFGPVKALMVQGRDGKYYPWFPESDRALGTLSVDKNGIYRASDKGVYGWSRVSVDVPQNEGVTGRDPDTGEEVYVHPDPEGELVKDVLPVEIRVIEPPTNPYGIYVDGQTITKDGMVVKAYDAKGNEMQAVPVGEITINPTTAVYDEQSDKPAGYITDGGEIAEQFPMYAEQVNFPIESSGNVTTESAYWDESLSGEYLFATNVYGSGATLWACSLEPSTVTRKTKAHGGSAEFTSEIPVNTRATFNGETFYVNQVISIDNQPEFVYHGPKKTTGNTTFIAYCILFGDTEETPVGSPQTITVSWPRPGDGAILETSFNITVTGGD